MTVVAPPGYLRGLVSVRGCTRVLALLVALTMLLAPVSRAAAAGFAWGTIECCCGEHAGDVACGCKDCPSATHDADHDGDGDGDGPADGAPTMQACGPNAQLITFSHGDEPILPPVDALLTADVRVVHPPPVPPPPPPHVVELETPPF